MFYLQVSNQVQFCVQYAHLKQLYINHAGPAIPTRKHMSA